jgi:hypothetical protein
MTPVDAKHSRWSKALASTIVLGLSACGGGGGGSSSTPESVTRPSSVATLSVDNNPTGGTAAPNMYPVNVGDLWINDQLDAQGVPTAVQETQRVLAQANGQYDFSSTQSNGSDSHQFSYTATPLGLASKISLFPEFDAQTQALRGDILVYPNTRYPTGTARTAIRQGDLGEDLDGDQINDAFRLEFTQTLIGLEHLNLPTLSAIQQTVYHFKTTVRHILIPSKAGNEPVERSMEEDDYVWPGVGSVRTERTYRSTEDTNVTTEKVALRSARINGKPYGALPSKISVMTVPVRIDQWRYEPVHQVYLGLVVAPLTSTGNAIAVIDANTGAIKGYSAALAGKVSDFKPTASGSDVYVAAGRDVVKLALTITGDSASMTEVGRLTLPMTTQFPNQGYEPTQLAVSPVDPSLIVVSAVAPALLTNPWETFVIRDLAIQTRLTTDARAWNFNKIGSLLLSFNQSASGETSLGFYELQFDGLVLVKRRIFPSLAGMIGTTEVDSTEDKMYFGQYILSLDTLSVSVNPLGQCRVQSQDRKLYCRTNNSVSTYAMDDLTLVGQLTDTEVNTLSTASSILPGPANTMTFVTSLYPQLSIVSVQALP